MLELVAAPQRNRNNPSVEADRHAYNAAFDELGLNWNWDAPTYSQLIGNDGGCVRRYLETEQPHLLRSYDADFLVAAIDAAKRRCAADPGHR